MDGNSQPLIIRHRPASFAEIRGHDGPVTALNRRLAEPGRPHTYLLTGPSGVGKTTIARLIGAEVNAAVEEIDAASNSGVDAMRQLVEDGGYVSPGAEAKLLLIDECHRLSRQAWDAMLKPLEEPPPHLYWALATSDFGHVPETVVTRCYHIKLDRVGSEAIGNLLVDVIMAEDWADIVQPEVFDLIVEAANGLPRQALTLLQEAYDAPDAGAARQIIATIGASESIIRAMQLLISGRGGWEAVKQVLMQIPDGEYNMDALNRGTRYVIGAINHTTTEAQAKRLWELLASLTCPAHTYDVKSLVYAAVGRFLWSGV